MEYLNSSYEIRASVFVVAQQETKILSTNIKAPKEALEANFHGTNDLKDTKKKF